LKKVGKKKTRAGFESYLYELSTRAYFALVFDQVDVESFVENAGEDDILQTLMVFASFLKNAR
jgi:hypothetical protein